MIAEQLVKKSRDWLNVSILLTVALCIGVYLIVTTAIIAKDGVTFIKYARQFETAPVKTMINKFQHPGYPWLILTAHKIMDSPHEKTSILSWIYCGQSVTLIFRLLTIIILYFIGKHLLGATLSFWAILIFIVLPKPAKYGGDALSDWPHLFFLTCGLLLLISGAVNKRWWLFGFAGFTAGMGYLIRPECAQLVVLGILWLGLQLLWSKRTISIAQALSALALLLFGFLVVAGPYMKLKGAIFPKKDIGQFASELRQAKIDTITNQTVSKATHTSQFAPLNIAKAFGKLAGNIGETLMWFFVPASLIGMHRWFRTQKGVVPEKFFIIVIIVLNIPVMIWLYCKYGYISDRHTLPLLIFPILYVPVGLQELAIWFQEKFHKKAVPSFVINNRNERFWFLVLFLIGISICAPKLLSPIRIEKQGYRMAAKWLEANTDSGDIVAVPDKRISFYAQRRGLVYENGNIPEQAAYVVKISKKQKDESAIAESSGKIVYKYVNKRKRGVNVIIHRNL